MVYYGMRIKIFNLNLVFSSPCSSEGWLCSNHTRSGGPWYMGGAGLPEEVDGDARGGQSRQR